MRHRLHLALWATLAAGLSTAAAAPEPKYSGKSLAYWVERLQKAESDEQRREAIVAIAAFKADVGPALPRLVEMLDDRSPEFRRFVVWIFERLGPDAKGAVPELVRLLKENAARDRAEVFEILGAIGPDGKQAVPILTEALADSEVVGPAIDALCKMGPAAKPSLPVIRKAILDAAGRKGGDAQIADLSIEPLVGLGSDGVPLLVELLS